MNRHYFYSIIVIIFFVSITQSQAQSVINRFFKLPCPEKRWVLFHPFVAKKAMTISDDAITETMKLASDTTLDGDINGGQLDAFRHSFWMATITQQLGSRKALSLGKAHEKGNFLYYKKHKIEEGTIPDFESGQMDLQNNEVGIAVGKENPSCKKSDLIFLLVSMIHEGKLFILKKDRLGRYLTCDEHLLLSSPHEWKSGKCITTSDYKRKEISEK